MKHSMSTIAAVVILAAAAGAAAEQPTRWLNVHVTEPETSTKVELHLPMNLVTSVLRGVDVDHFHAGKVDLEIEDADIDWAQILSAVSDAPDGDFVKATTEDAEVSVTKRQGTVFIHVTEKDGDHAVVDVTMPIRMVEALTVDDSNQIDVAALLESFTELPDGDLVRVHSDDAEVRVWIESP